jgi:hypothetical protein
MHDRVRGAIGPEEPETAVLTKSLTSGIRFAFVFWHREPAGVDPEHGLADVTVSTTANGARLMFGSSSKGMVRS